MKRRHFRVLAGFCALGAITACIVDPLNPQPLPPGQPTDFGGYDAGFGTTDSGVRGSNDAAAEPNTPDPDGGIDLNDAGPPSADAGDASDADASSADASDADATVK